MKFAALSALLGLASLASARTDLEGCVSSMVVINYGASYLWYVPDSGEICSFLDCGGGRAPPKTTVPGCPGYHGTATVTPDYIEGWGPNGKQAASTTTVQSTSAAASTTAEALTTTQASETTAASDASETIASSSSSASSPENTSLTASDLTATESMTITTSPSLATADATSAAATSSPTFNAANAPVAKGAGVMAIVAAMVGAIAL
jgi:hypothetical protein